MQNASKLTGKRTVTGQNSGELYKILGGIKLMKPYEPNLNRNSNDGWNIKKFLIALVFILIGAMVIIYINYSVENKEGTTMAQELRNMFPALSQESAEKFVRKASDRKLTDEEFLTWADELAAKGEVFLSYSQKEEMASFWWKAVGKLPAEQQDFIQSVATKMRSEQQITLEESGLVSIYVEHGFSLLSQEDKDRYLYLRSEALEEALRRE